MKRQLILILLLIGGQIFAQVNTETMRKADLSPGQHFSLGAQLNYLQGNSQVLQARLQGNWYYVFSRGQVFLNLNQKLSRKDKVAFVNQGFVHLRGTRQLRPRLEGELYTQREYNEFINLQSRQLFGAGLRLGLLAPPPDAEAAEVTMTLGTSLMFEEERMDAGPNGDLGDPVHGELAQLLRSSNYLLLAWSPGESWRVSSTSYYQVDTKRLSDFRVLSQSRLRVGLSQRLVLDIVWNLRYDSEPPKNIEDLDMEISQGLTYRFP